MSEPKKRNWFRSLFSRKKSENLSKGDFAIQSSSSRSKESTTKFIPEHKKDWIKPEKPFYKQEEAYRKDGLLKEAIDFVVDEICGNGFYVTGNLEYKEKLEGKTAIEVINEFNEKVNLDEFLQILARNLYAYGNAFISIKDIQDFKLIPTKSISRAMLKGKKYSLVQTANYGAEEIRNSDFLHLRWNVDADTVLGQGIILAMLATYKDTPNLLESRATMKKMLLEGLKKFGNPNELWAMPGLPDAKIQELNNQKNEMDTSGERLFTNVEAKIQTVRTERPSTYDKVIDLFETEFLLIAGNPVLRVLAVPSLPPTIGEVLKDLHQRRINLLQRILKRGIEEIWRRLLKENLFDPVEAHIRLNFGMEPVEEITIDQIITASQTQVEGKPLISREEARKMLKKYGKFELETEETQKETEHEG